MTPFIKAQIDGEVRQQMDILLKRRHPDGHDASAWPDIERCEAGLRASITQRMYLRACEPITRAIVDLHLFALPKYELGADGLRLVDDGLTPAMRSSLNQLHEWLASVARDHGVTYIPPAPITKEHNSHENQPRPQD